MTLSTLAQKKCDLVPIADKPGLYGYSEEYIDNEINKMKDIFWEKRTLDGQKIPIHVYEGMIKAKEAEIEVFKQSENPNQLLIDQARKEIDKIRHTIQEVKIFKNDVRARRDELESYHVSQDKLGSIVQKFIEKTADFYEMNYSIQWFPGAIEERLRQEFPGPDWDEMERIQRRLDKIDKLQKEGKTARIEQSIKILKNKFERETYKYEDKINKLVNQIPTHPLYKQYALIVHQEYQKAKELTQPLTLLLPKLDITNQSIMKYLENQITEYFSLFNSSINSETNHELKMFPDNSNGFFTLKEYAEKLIEVIYTSTLKTVQDNEFIETLLIRRNGMIFHLINTLQTKFHIDFGLKFEGTKFSGANNKIINNFINPAPASPVVVEEVDEVINEVKPVQQQALPPPPPQPIIEPAIKTIDEFIKSLPGSEWEYGFLLEQYNNFFNTNYSSVAFRQNKEIKAHFKSLGRRSIGNGKKATFYGLK